MYKPTRTQPLNAAVQKAPNRPAAPQTRKPPAPHAFGTRPAPKVLQTKTAASMSPLKARTESRPAPQAVQRPQPPAKVLQPKTHAAPRPVNQLRGVTSAPSAQRTQPALNTLQTKKAAGQEALKRRMPFASAPTSAPTKAKPNAAHGRPSASPAAAGVGTLQRKPSVVVPARPGFELKRAAFVPPSASGVIQRSGSASAAAAPAKAPAKAAAVATVEKVITYDQLKAYIASKKYFVNAKQQYYESSGTNRDYGVKIKIIRKDKSQNSVQTWVHFHYTANGPVASAHFKNGPGKAANQGFDFPASDAATLINALLGANLSETDWKSIKGIAL
jgi:hypothetical protein